MESILFYILAVIGVIAAVAMITRVNPIMSVIWLVVCFLTVAGMFALLAAPLMAVLQILVMAGAIMVLFLFVVMAVDLGPEALPRREMSFGKILGAAACSYLAIVLILAVFRSPAVSPPASGPSYESAATLARLLTAYNLVPFELAGVLLLVAVIAGVVLAKKKL